MTEREDPELDALAEQFPGWTIWRQFAAREQGTLDLVTAVTAEQLRHRIETGCSRLAPCAEHDPGRETAQ